MNFIFFNSHFIFFYSKFIFLNRTLSFLIRILSFSNRNLTFLNRTLFFNSNLIIFNLNFIFFKLGLKRCRTCSYMRLNDKYHPLVSSALSSGVFIRIKQNETPYNSVILFIHKSKYPSPVSCVGKWYCQGVFASRDERLPSFPIRSNPRPAYTSIC